MKLFSQSTLRPFDYFLILGVTVSSIAYSLLAGEFDAMGTVAGISGVVCVVLVAKRSMLNYLFGLVNVTLYALIAYKSRIYGDAVLNAFYYLPMQFVGWFSWRRNLSSDDGSRVEARTLSVRGRIVWSIITAAAVTLCAVVLKRVGDPQPVKDSATTVMSVIAMYFMTRMLAEQWVLWIVVNVISVIMWAICTARGDAHAALMVIMWAFYLANSVNGLVVWSRKSAGRP